MALIRHIEEKGAHFWCQKIGWRRPLAVAMRHSATAVENRHQALSATARRVLVKSAEEGGVIHQFFT